MSELSDDPRRDATIAQLRLARDALESERDVLRRRVSVLEASLASVMKERDAYKRAKAENDDRYMIERDEARAELAIGREECERASVSTTLDGVVRAFFDLTGDTQTRDEATLGARIAAWGRQVLKERSEALATIVQMRAAFHETAGALQCTRIRAEKMEAERDLLRQALTLEAGLRKDAEAGTREALRSALVPLRKEHDSHASPDPSCPFCTGDVT